MKKRLCLVANLFIGEYFPMWFIYLYGSLILGPQWDFWFANIFEIWTDFILLLLKFHLRSAARVLLIIKFIAWVLHFRNTLNSLTLWPVGITYDCNDQKRNGILKQKTKYFIQHWYVKCQCVYCPLQLQKHLQTLFLVLSPLSVMMVIIWWNKKHNQYIGTHILSWKAPNKG